MQERKGYYETGRGGDQFGLPVAVLAVNVISNGLHWHDHMEILFCRKGCMKLRADGVEHRLLPGDFITINSGVRHEIYDGQEGNLQIICSIDAKAMRDMETHQIVCQSIHKERGLDDVSSEDQMEIREALVEMAVLSLEPESLLGEENWNRYHMYLYQLLSVLAKYKKESRQTNPKKRDTLNECVRYIHEHLAGTLDAAVLAKNFHRSEPTIYRMFAEQIGMHLGEYITSVRINAACRYLEETSEKVINIAYACGFTGLSNFYRIFHQIVGETPTAYRKSHSAAGIPLSVRRIQPDIMKLNRFQRMDEMGYGKDELR